MTSKVLPVAITLGWALSCQSLAQAKTDPPSPSDLLPIDQQLVLEQTDAEQQLPAVDPSGLHQDPEVNLDDSEEEETLSAPSAWRGTLELYGLAPLKLDTRTTINGFTTNADLNLGGVLERLEWASSLRASVEHNRVGLLTDLYYSKIGQKAARTTPRDQITGKAKLGATQGIYDLALRYRIGDTESAIGKKGQASLIPYAGVRVIDARLDTKVEIVNNGQTAFVRDGNFGRTWAQPLLGTQATVFLSPRLRAFARGDIAGFGLSGKRDLSGNAQLGLGYAIGNNTDLNISWRYLGIEYDNRKTPQSGFKSTQNAIEVGLKFFF